MHSDGQPCHLCQQKNDFARPEPVPGFLTLYVVVFIVVSDFEVTVKIITYHKKHKHTEQGRNYH